MCIRDRTFSSDLSQVPTVQHFITEDEIDAAMTGGSSFAGGKGRIYAVSYTHLDVYKRQADGDVIDFTAKLFDLSPKEAAEKLAQDFGLIYDSPVSYTHLDVYKRQPLLRQNY